MLTRAQRIYIITLVGSFANFLLVVLKFIAGIVGHSAAMIADAVHSLSDFMTDFVVLIMVHIGNRPSDRDHNFGHGKYETLATSIIGITLVVVAGGIAWDAVERICTLLSGGNLQAPTMLAFWMAIASIAIKELVYQFTIIKGRSLQSKALEANAWHHRSDALSSVGSALGIGGAILLGKHWVILDPLAALVVAGFIVAIAWKLIRVSVNELLEVSLPIETEEEIKRITYSVPGITDVHKLRTRQIGNVCAINMHLRLDGYITLIEAHNHATQVEHMLKARFGQGTIVSIHIEPFEEHYK